VFSAPKFVPGAVMLIVVSFEMLEMPRRGVELAS